MSNNRTFFKNARAGHLSLRDIFSDVTRKHTPEESARLFIAGTALTTPDESEMLAGWQKPFMFARFALATLACMVMFFLLGDYAVGGYDPFLACMAMMVPMTLLLLVWEMNIPRTISLMEVLKVVGVGGVLSLVFAIVLFQLDLVDSAVMAPIAEEPAKFAVVYILLSRKNRKYILEGLLLGVAVGTGFAIVETFGYIMSSSREELVYACIDAMNGNLPAEKIFEVSYNKGFRTALVRAVNAIAGHGFYAGLYSAGIMMAKKDEPISPKHLLSMDFLVYFGISCVLHALNNSDFTDKFFPDFEIGGYPIWSYSLVQTVIAVILLLSVMKKGVNQIVEISAGLNDGRVTLAVNREVADVKYGGGSSGGSGGHGAAGRIDFLSGPLAGQSFPLRAGQQMTIGRSPACSIPVTGSGSISGNHCAVMLNGSMILVTDLGSTNGTYIGGQRLNPQQPTPVPDGGTVYLGNQSCAFRITVG